ncbi:MAG: hypothetical protein IKH81_00805 [Clostridia bacterium]|nr:hypothetical protein [Clostridia bacterium]
MAGIWIQKMRKGASGKKGISFRFLAASLLCILIMLISYLQSGVNTFTPVLSGTVIALLVVCIVLAAVSCFFEIKNLKYILYLLSFWSWLKHLVYNASYISNVMVGIDGNLFTTGFLLTAVTGLFAWIFALVSAILQKNETGISSGQITDPETEE